MCAASIPECLMVCVYLAGNTRYPKEKPQYPWPLRRNMNTQEKDSVFLPGGREDLGTQ